MGLDFAVLFFARRLTPFGTDSGTTPSGDTTSVMDGGCRWILVGVPTKLSSPPCLYSGDTGQEGPPCGQGRDKPLPPSPANPTTCAKSTRLFFGGSKLVS